MSLHFYGIPNCDTVRKARAWLDGRGIEYAFHDYKKEGVSRELLDAWMGKVGWEALLNRAGTTFRALAEEEKSGLGPDKAISLMLAQPSMIKRPVLHAGRVFLVGFKPEEYARAFGG